MTKMGNFPFQEISILLEINIVIEFWWRYSQGKDRQSGDCVWVYLAAWAVYIHYQHELEEEKRAHEVF